MLHIVCWLWHDPYGRREGVYKDCHVNALSRMLDEHMSIPYELTCITDVPEMKVECNTYPIWPLPKVSSKINSFVRLNLFNPEIGKEFGERILSIDLDVLIEDDLAPLVENAPDFCGIEGRAARVNGSLWTLKTGTNAHVWETFDPQRSVKEISRSKHHGSDQAWMSIQMPDCPVWTGNDDGTWLFKDIRRKTTCPQWRRFVAFPGVDFPWVNNQSHQGFQQMHKKYMSYL